MAIAEKLSPYGRSPAGGQQKSEALKTKMAEKSHEAEKGKGAEIDSMEWLLLFLAAGFIGVLSLILTVIGLIPVVGQIIYVIVNVPFDIIATGIFWLYLQYKGLGGYWWLTFGGGLASFIPVVDCLSWIVAVLILYLLVKAEKIPLAGEAIEKAARVASKVK